MISGFRNQKNVNGQNVHVIAELSIKEAMFPRDKCLPPLPIEETARITDTNWRFSVTSLTTLSKQMSQIAVSKATNRQIRQFATFELEECIALVDVLADAGIGEPAVAMQDEAALFNMKNAAAGRTFDEHYLHSQLQLHERLEIITKTYLKQVSHSSPKDSLTRRFGVLTLATCREHLCLLQQIIQSGKCMGTIST